MTDLNIYQVMPEENEQNVKRELHEHLPNVYKAEALLLVSPLRGGKTSLICNLLEREEFYKDLFNNVDIISPTVAQDSTWRFLYQKYKNACHLEYNDGVIQHIMERQQGLMANDEDSSYCVIADDILGQIPASRARKGNLLTYWLCRFRHYVKKPDPCLFILSTQKFREVNATLRANSTGVFISSNIRNQKEIEALAEEYADTMGGKEVFYKMLNYVRKEKYQWLYLQLTTGKAFKNFTEMLYDGDKLLIGKGEKGDLEEEEEISSDED